MSSVYIDFKLEGNWQPAHEQCIPLYSWPMSHVDRLSHWLCYFGLVPNSFNRRSTCGPQMVAIRQVLTNTGHTVFLN